MANFVKFVQEVYDEDSASYSYFERQINANHIQGLADVSWTGKEQTRVELTSGENIVVKGRIEAIKAML